MRDQVIVGLIWIGLTAAGEVAADRWLQALPVVASVEGRVVDESFGTLVRVLVPVFTFVITLLGYAAVRFRARGPVPRNVGGPDMGPHTPPRSAAPRGTRGAPRSHFLSDAPRPRPPGARDNRLFSWSWVGVTTALNVLLVIHPGITGLNAILAGPPPELVVQVWAKQWSWSFAYPEHGVSVKDQLVLPAGKRVRFEITSEDVVHAFWVPAFRLKLDAVPGLVTTLHLTPDREISTRDDLNVRVQCAELCGTGHATMRATVRVVSAEAFEQWIAARRPRS